ncbi:hypothetical protein GCM10009733_020090 [Nonomuraea maheshkhaliensis]|uniref:MobA/VirD2-like nuclease domain-containing protein n=1 Tax=Nonomuraea maheshkhaliensis TaxID=419590 RepID=A0ABN2EZI6_9ACTN
MIVKVVKGSKTYGLLRYLYGPGRYEEHQTPHLVAAWDTHEADPAIVPEEQRAKALHALARHLDRPVDAYAGRLPHHVWHTSVRVAPGDPTLDDGQWAQVARRLVSASGVAPEGDRKGCRWVAIRHADDHVHLVATLVRQDGRRPNLRGDYYRLRDECRALELELGLRVTAEADRTAACSPTRAERAIAHRVRRSQVTSREVLETKVRNVALAASSESDFFAGLGRDPQMSVTLRKSPSGEVVGYAVTLAGNVSADGTQIWYGGWKLAPDLSLPRVRQRWTHPGGPNSALTRPTVQPETGAAARGQSFPRTAQAQQSKIAAWQQATAAVREGTTVLQQGGPGTAATAAALADLVTVSAGRAPARVRRQVTIAARHLQRLGREPWKERNEAAQRTHLAMRAVMTAGRMLGQADEEAAAVMALLVATVMAVSAIAAHHRTARREAHARVARLASEHLQHAAQLLTAVPSSQRDLAAANRTDLHTVVRRVLSGRTDPEQILRDPAWPALAGTLQLLQRLGHDAPTVLAAVAGARPLRRDRVSPSRSDAQVLTWRLQRWIAERQTDQSDRRTVAYRGHTSTTLDRPTGTPSASTVAEDSKLRALARVALARRSADPDAVVHDPAWPGVAAALAQISSAGFDVEKVLETVAGVRPLREDASSPARSEAQVLAWRLQKWFEKASATAAIEQRSAQARARSGTQTSPTASSRVHPPASRPASDSGVFRPADDPVFRRAVLAVVEAQECSPALLERMLWVRPDVAAELVAKLQSRGVITPMPGRSAGQAQHRVAIPADALAELHDTTHRPRAQPGQPAPAATAVTPRTSAAHPGSSRPDARQPHRR